MAADCRHEFVYIRTEQQFTGARQNAQQVDVFHCKYCLVYNRVTQPRN